MKTIIVLLFCLAACFATKLPPRPSQHTTGRIVGGSDAAEGQFPFILSFRYPSLDWHYCGGSIIAPRWAITAGHCCEGVSARDVTIVVGTNTLNEGGDQYEVSNIHIHPEFELTDTDLNNDICLLHIKSEIQLNDRVQTIPLNQGLDDSAQDATVAGWGNTQAGGNAPNELQWLPTSLVPHQECVDAWGSHAYYPIRETQVCAFAQEGQGACNGDSGGPLTTLDSDGNTVLTGLVSWGDPCALGYPDLYTKVGSYVEWINSVITRAEE